MSKRVKLSVRMYEGEKFAGAVVANTFQDKDFVNEVDNLLKSQREMGFSGLRTNVMVRDAKTNRLVKWANK